MVLKRKGVHLFLDWTQLDDVKTKGGNLTIFWSEQFVNRYDYTIKILDNRAGEAAGMFIATGCLNEARIVPIPAKECESIRHGRVEAQRIRVRMLEDELAGLRKKLAVLVNEFDPAVEPNHHDDSVDIHGPGTCEASGDGAETGSESDSEAEGISREMHPCHHCGDGSWSQAESAYVTEGGAIMKRMDQITLVMERERANLYFAAFDTIQRSPLIPEHVENKDVWYDAYYDAKHDAYVHVGDTWPAGPDVQKLRKEMNLPYGCGLSPYPESMVDMVFGQPALKDRYGMVRFWVHGWRGMPKIGIENYHYMRVMGERWPRLHGNYYYDMVPNSAGHNSYPKEYIRLNRRTGRTVGWARSERVPLVAEILEEEIQLAREGNANYMALALEDTSHADGEDISHMPNSFRGDRDGVDWFPSTYEK